MHTDNYWHQLPNYMLAAGLNPTLAGALLVPLKMHVKALQADLYRALPEEEADRAWQAVRDHIYGHVPPGADA